MVSGPTTSGRLAHLAFVLSVLFSGSFFLLLLIVGFASALIAALGSSSGADPTLVVPFAIVALIVSWAIAFIAGVVGIGVYMPLAWIISRCIRVVMGKQPQA